MAWRCWPTAQSTKPRRRGSGRRSRRSDAQHFQKLKDEGRLPLIDLGQCSLGAEPRRPIDFGKGLPLARAWRPFDLESVAPERRRGVEVVLDSPGFDHLA